MAKENNKGITLIALVITIIIMLILAGTSVTVALNGGLFNAAKKAESETYLREEEELLFSAAFGAIGEDLKVNFQKLKTPEGFNKIAERTYKSSSGNVYIITEDGEIQKFIEENDTNATIEVPYEELTDELKTAINEGKITKVLKEVKYGIEMLAVIPSGFEVSTTNGENKISEGLVISDSDGNEFVWVPCTTDNNGTSRLTKYAEDTRYNDGTIASFQKNYISYIDWQGKSGNIDSVTKYGGFYVGRYEAGIPNNAPFYANTDGAEYIVDGRDSAEYIPVSKSGEPVWNFISQQNAKIASEAMYSTSTSVESRLIDAYAWDTIVNWMEGKYPGIATNSKNYGNYLNSSVSFTNSLYSIYQYSYIEKKWLINPSTNYVKGTVEVPARGETGEPIIYEISSGSTDKTKVLNIYDMAGNILEWTTEFGYHNGGTTGRQFAVNRGGYSNKLGDVNPITHRDGNGGIEFKDYYTGFRVVLYVK